MSDGKPPEGTTNLTVGRPAKAIMYYDPEFVSMQLVGVDGPGKVGWYRREHDENGRESWVGPFETQEAASAK